MHVALLILEGANELDSFVALTMLRRVTRPDWQVQLVAPTPTIVSGGGVTIAAQAGMAALQDADAVLIGSGQFTERYAQDADFLAQLALDPQRQLIGAQCSGPLLLQAKGLLPNRVTCTDLFTKPLLESRGARALDRAFHAEGNVATAGGCLASAYLAAWMILKLTDAETASTVLYQVAPVGEKESYVAHALGMIGAMPVSAL
jgi:transcriptional regulator GlxA family with amidase domain